MPGGDADGMYDDIIDDGILESLIIIMLAGALVFLIYWRQQHQLRHRGEQQAAEAQQGQQNQQHQQQDRGLFPQPGDPDFNAWVAGGIGH